MAVWDLYCASLSIQSPPSSIPVTIIPSKFFLPFDLVKLGRFITDIDQPNLRFHDPPDAEGPQSIVSEFLFSGQSQQSTNTSFASVLKPLVSLGLSGRANANIEIAPAYCKRYFLNNSDD